MQVFYMDPSCSYLYLHSLHRGVFFDSKIDLKCDVACYEQVSFRYSRRSSKHQEVNILFIYFGIIQIKIS